MSSVHMDLDGKGVYLTQLRCANYGHKKVYKVTAEYDGIERQVGEEYSELEDMLVKAGYQKPAYQHRAIIPMPRIKATLEAHNNRYRVSVVYAQDGTQVTRQQVIEERAERGKELEALGNRYKGVPISQRFGMARQAKRQAEMNARFAHGEKIIRDLLADKKTVALYEKMYELVNDIRLDGVLRWHT